jgi:hypothetical protein
MRRIITLKVTVIDKGRSHSNLVTEFRENLEGVKGFYEIEELKASDPLDLDEIEGDESLSHNQIRFIKDAMAQGLEVRYNYSGRGMDGRMCPAVHIKQYGDELETSADFNRDSMGMGKVLYASS